MLREQSSETRVKTCGQEGVLATGYQGRSQILLVREGLALLRNKDPVSPKNLRHVLEDPSVFEQKVLETHKRQAAAPTCALRPYTRTHACSPSQAAQGTTCQVAGATSYIEIPGDAGPSDTGVFFNPAGTQSHFSAHAGSQMLPP